MTSTTTTIAPNFGALSEAVDTFTSKAVEDGLFTAIQAQTLRDMLDRANVVLTCAPAGAERDEARTEMVQLVAALIGNGHFHLTGGDHFITEVDAYVVAVYPHLDAYWE